MTAIDNGGKKRVVQLKEKDMSTLLIDSKTAKNVGTVVDTLIYNDAWRATKYLSATSVIRATRKRFGKCGWKKSDRIAEISLTLGAPNYLERQFIKECKAAGVPFPVKRIQLKARPISKSK